MGDSKISGLVAVAAFAATQEFAVNDSGTSKKISGSQLQAAFPLGTVTAGGYAQAVANQTPITAEVDLTGLTLTVTTGASRRYKITGYLPQVDSTVSGDFGVLRIYEDATQIQAANFELASTAGEFFAIAVAVRTPTAAAHTYKLTLARASGTGNLRMVGALTNPAFILVEDVSV